MIETKIQIFNKKILENIKTYPGQRISQYVEIAKLEAEIIGLDLQEHYKQTTKIIQPRDYGGRFSTTFTKDNINRIIHLHELGEKLKTIAAEFKCKGSTISKIISTYKYHQLNQTTS